MNITQALKSLRPGAKWHLVGDTYDGLDWRDNEQDKPTKEEINNEIQSLIIKNDYQTHRANYYPSVEEQLDMLWHAMDEGKLPKVKDFYESIKAVKEQFPKNPKTVNIIPDTTGQK